MNIALIGYGKMGKAIERIALQRGHQVVLKIDEHNLDEFDAGHLAAADVAIEFTGPHSAFENVKKLVNLGTVTVCGSTGWTENLDEINQLCQKKGGSFIYASNFSVGVNIFFELNKKLAQLMAPHAEYAVSMEEIHHTQKKDAPSGTAITLAEQIINLLPGKTKWVNVKSEKEEELSIISKRIDPAPGTHTIKYASDVDQVEIIHTAHSREGFALGAVLAAEFLKGKKGVFSMKEVLGFA